MQPTDLLAREKSVVLLAQIILFGFGFTLNGEISPDICSLRSVAVMYLLLSYWLVVLVLPLASMLSGEKL